MALTNNELVVEKTRGSRKKSHFVGIVRTGLEPDFAQKSPRSLVVAMDAPTGSGPFLPFVERTT